ncbi:hypothetical protein ACKC9G_08265 [Pokkaliibacter sp. CJK22405]|uniref:hypothetical protein n=1 Tax=Pokkaliibacter sp. CJK22405 TaxID=3384615 RepID=UPI0039849927
MSASNRQQPSPPPTHKRHRRSGPKPSPEELPWRAPHRLFAAFTPVIMSIAIGMQAPISWLVLEHQTWTALKPLMTVLWVIFFVLTMTSSFAIRFAKPWALPLLITLSSGLLVLSLLFTLLIPEGAYAGQPFFEMTGVLLPLLALGMYRSRAMAALFDYNRRFRELRRKAQAGRG